MDSNLFHNDDAYFVSTLAPPSAGGELDYDLLGYEAAWVSRDGLSEPLLLTQGRLLNASGALLRVAQAWRDSSPLRH